MYLAPGKVGCVWDGVPCELLALEPSWTGSGRRGGEDLVVGAIVGPPLRGWALNGNNGSWTNTDDFDWENIVPSVVILHLGQREIAAIYGMVTSALRLCRTTTLSFHEAVCHLMATLPSLERYEPWMVACISRLSEPVNIRFTELFVLIVADRTSDQEFAEIHLTPLTRRAVLDAYRDNGLVIASQYDYGPDMPPTGGSRDHSAVLVYHAVRMTSDTPPSSAPRDSQLGSSHGNVTEEDDHPRRASSDPGHTRGRGRLNIINERPRGLGSRSANHDKHRGGVDFGPPTDTTEHYQQVAFALERANTPATEALWEGSSTSSWKSADEVKYVVGASTAEGELPYQCVYGRFHRWQNCRWVDQSGGELSLPTIAEGTVIPGYAMDSDGLYSPSERKETPAWSGWELVDSVSYTESGVDKLFRRRWLYSAAIKLLRQQFAASKPSEEIFRAVYNTVLKKFVWMPVQLAVDTATYYCLLVARVNNCLLEAGVAVGSSLAPNEYYEEVSSSLLAPGEYDQVNMGCRRRQYVECTEFPPKHPLARRDIFRVAMARAASINADGKLVYDGVVEEPTGRLTYPRVLTKTPRQYLIGAEFRHSTTKLLMARASANNQASALTRLFKCRGGTRETDEAYSRRQLSVLSRVVSLDDPDVLRLGNAAFSNYPIGLSDYEAIISFSKEVGGQVWRKDYQLRRRDSQGGISPSVSIAQMFELFFDEYSRFGCWWWLLMLWVRIRGPVFKWAGRVCYYTLFLPYWIAGFLVGRWWYSRLHHPKQALRRMIMDRFPGALTPEYPSYCRQMRAEVKDEPLKEGKPPRLFFSLGFAAPLFAGHVPELGKAAMKGERRVQLDNFAVYMLYTDENTPQNIGRVFTRMHERVNSAERCVYFLYFSDDSVLAHNLTDAPCYWNVDISMCDASNGYGIFAVVFHYLVRLGFPRSQVLGLLEQCTKRFQLSHPDSPDMTLWGEFLTFFQVSGTVLTTQINNWANLLVLAAICASFDHGEYSCTAVQRWIANAGYVVTMEPCAEFEQVTFLKRCPVECEGGFVAPLVAGTLLRTFGIVRRELDESVIPGSRTWSLERRVAAFLGGVVEGWKNEPTTPILNSLRVAFPFVTTVRRTEEFLRPEGGEDNREVLLESYCRRYGLDPCVLVGFAARVSEMRVWSAIQHEALDRILEVDYGM